jgi:KDO2-lipid IV(A) lauroyltransferase
LQSQLARLVLRMRALAKPAIDGAGAALAIMLLKAIRRTNAGRVAAFGARALRKIGPWLPEHRTGRANLASAFPEKSAEEIESILVKVWENLGRIGAEYAHLDRLVEGDFSDSDRARIRVRAASQTHFLNLRADGKPALFFAAHLANWELPAIVATKNDLDTAILYRQPNIAGIAAAIQEIRAVNMGELIPTSGVNSVFRVAAALERGAHVGMLVDQHFSRGVDVTFFGRTCKANPLLARLARRFECPIHGARVIRLPNDRFEVQLTEEIAPARGEDGAIDVQRTMQIVTSIVEGWVREHPDQWLWLHRRWR